MTANDRQERTPRHHPPPSRHARRALLHAEGLRRGTAGALSATPPPGPRPPWPSWCPGADAEMAHRVDDLLLPIVKGVGFERVPIGSTKSPADPRWLRVPAGLSDRAVHPRRQDRLALRGHHRDPGAGLLLPQDRPRSGRRAGARGRARSRPSSTATPLGPSWPRGERFGHGARRSCRRWSPAMTGYPARPRRRTPASCIRVGLESVPFLLAAGDLC